jgi:tRNA dimethylallyltransferase
MSTPILAIVGPTASGKTRRAVDVAKALNGEIISGDSRQVYCGMDVGSGKDLDEYGDVPYHLIDIAAAGEKYNLFQYLSDASRAIDNIVARGLTPVVCGGTGLYVESLLKGMSLPEVPENPELRQSLTGKSLDELKTILEGMKSLHNVTDLDTEKRAIRAIEIQTYYREHPEAAAGVKAPQPRHSVIVGVDIDRESRRRRITERLDARIAEGMTDEVERLLASGIKPDDLIYYGLEYKFVTLYVTGAISFEQMRNDLEIAIHQFAKRQMTWFRGMERRGFHINWLPYDLPTDEFVDRCTRLYNAAKEE